MKRFLALLGIFLIIFMFAPAFSQEWKTQEDTGAEGDLEETKILSVSACSLKPHSYKDCKRPWFISQAGAWLNFDPKSDLFLSAPVYLPHKAVVKKIFVYCKDYIDPNHLVVGLNRTDMTTGLSENLGSISTENLVPSPDTIVLIDSSIDYPRVNNNKYSYFLGVYFSSGAGSLMVFHGAKIIYKYSSI